MVKCRSSQSCLFKRSCFVRLDIRCHLTERMIERIENKLLPLFATDTTVYIL